MYIVGLTGGIGSGKSTVARIFQDFGAPVVDTDEIAHQLSRANQPGAQAVGQIFGADFLTADGAIDRLKLRQHVFRDSSAKQRLEAALHPLIRQEVDRQLIALAGSNPSYVLLAVPLLFETGGYQNLVNAALVVDCPESMQIQRVMARSKLGRDEVDAIMRQQLSRTARLAQADDIILNDGDLNSLQEKIKELHRKYAQATESEQDSP